MRKMDCHLLPNDTDIYHITHIGNLAQIITHNGLYCDNVRVKMSIHIENIAHQHIRARRTDRKVPVCKLGTLGDYVPFYFAPSSPMLYAIARQQVMNVHCEQSKVLHLRSSVQTVSQSSLNYCFTDGHAVIAFSKFFDNIRQLDRIDWNIMTEVYWSDTDQDKDRKRRRQAEFLVSGFFPWKLILEIGVMNQEMMDEVNFYLQGNEHHPIVSVHRDWYY